MQGACSVREDEGGEDIERRLLAHARECREEDLFRVTLDHLQHRRLFDLVLGGEFGEYRRLHDAETNPQADCDQRDREQERHAPAPSQELLTGHLAEGEHREIGEEQPARHAELRP